MSCSLSCFENIVRLCRYQSHWCHVCVAKGEREKNHPHFNFHLWECGSLRQPCSGHCSTSITSNPRNKVQNLSCLFWTAWDCCSKFPVVQTLFFELNHKLQVLEVWQGGEKLPAEESSEWDKEYYRQCLQIGVPMKIAQKFPCGCHGPAGTSERTFSRLGATEGLLPCCMCCYTGRIF